MNSKTQDIVKTFSQTNQDKEPFGSFTDSILEQCNHSFSLMYYHIFKQYWHTGMDMRMPRNYCVTKWQEGIYEVYIPTQAHMSKNMQYYRIIVKVVAELDKEKVKEYGKTLEVQQISPNGTVDSELVCLIAPQRSEKARKERQFLRGFNHTRTKMKGYLTAIVINPIPEICMKRLLTIIAKFLKTRISKLLEKLNFQPWQYDYKDKEYLYYSKLVDIIEGFSYWIAQTLRCLSHSLNWVLMKIKHTLRSVGRQNMARMAINKFFELKSLLRDMKFGKPEIVAEMEAVLIARVRNCHWIKQPLKTSEWQKRRRKVTLEWTPQERLILQSASKEGGHHG